MNAYEIIFFVWAIVGGISGTLFQMTQYDYGPKDPRCIIYFAISTWKNTDDLNILGRIICVVIVQLAVLPGSILILISDCLIWISIEIWKTFKFIFKKRHNK